MTIGIGRSIHSADGSFYRRRMDNNNWGSKFQISGWSFRDKLPYLKETPSGLY